MIDIKKKWGTRSGLDVRLVSDQGHPDWPIVGYVDNFSEPVCWDSEGLYIGTSEPGDYDLVEAKEKNVMYVLMDKNGDYDITRIPEQSDKVNYVLRIRVEYEEGQFDE